MEERERQEKRKKEKEKKRKERKGGKGERKTKVIMYTQSTQKQLIKTTKKVATSAISEHRYNQIQWQYANIFHI